jgi:hypothetical protein
MLSSGEELVERLKEMMGNEENREEQTKREDQYNKI